MKLTIKELERKYNSMTNQELCLDLGISMPTLGRLLKKSGIKRKGSGRTTKYRLV